MKVKIIKTYDLSKEEDEYDYKQDLKAREENREYSIYTNNFENFLREKIKYSELTEVEYKVYDEIRDKYFEFKNEFNIEE